MRSLLDIKGVEDIPARCPECGLPLAAMVATLGRGFLAIHVKVHEDLERAVFKYNAERGGLN